MYVHAALHPCIPVIQLLLPRPDHLRLCVTSSHYLLHFTVHLVHTHTHAGQVSHKVLAK